MENLFKDHSAVIAKIPDYFYPALLGEIVAVFGTQALSYADEYGLSSGTFGWVYAVKQTCEKLEMTWILDYYEKLDWYDSDRFDGELEERCCELIGDPDGKEQKYFAYYQWLSNKFTPAD